MNTTVFTLLIKRYNELSYTHNYLFGFNYQGTVYCATATAEVLPFVCTLDTASRGAGCALRFKPNGRQKEILKGFQCFPVCSVEFLESEANETQYNRGEIFEKLVTEHFGQKWQKDNVPFTKAGDIVVNGTHYQIKYEKATFINEKTLQHLGAI